MKLVHAADLHLDSPMLGLERYEGAPVHRLRNATREAFEGLISLCIEEEAKLLLLAGDLYDGNWKDYSTGLYFAKEMSKLRRAGVRVVWIRGNHDAQSQIAKNLELPDNVRELGHKKPETVVFEDLGVAVHGQSFATREVSENLALAYPAPRSGLINVGLLHTSVTGRPGHDPYAPCTLEDLASRGYDYFALGHVHQREVLSEAPHVVFPGNLQGRHARETGEKGATLLTLGADRIESVEHRVLDSVRWARAEIDASDCASPDDVLALLTRALEAERGRAETRLLAVRVVVRGESRAHGALARDPDKWLAEARACAADLGDDDVWLEKVRFETRDPASAAELGGRDDAVAQVVAGIRELMARESDLARLGEELADLAQKLPPALRDGPEGLRLGEPEFLRRALADVESLLVPRLLARGDE